MNGPSLPPGAARMPQLAGGEERLAPPGAGRLPQLAGGEERLAPQDAVRLPQLAGGEERLAPQDAVRLPQLAGGEERLAPQGSARLPQQAAREDERRREPRSSACRLRSIFARIRGGHEIALIDVSASGARIAGPRPLRPGARVDVHLTLDARHVVIAAHVARCLVAAIDAERGITYQSALAFEGRVDWPCEDDTLLVSSMHEVCSA